MNKKTEGRKSMMRWLSGVLLLVQVLTACSPASQSSPAAQVTLGSTAQTSGSQHEIVLAPGWDVGLREGFDPTLGWNYYGTPLFQSTLLRRDENLKLTNDLAQSYTVSNDRKVWTVKIRSDARFSDGEPLTAADVVFTFNQAKRNAGLVDLTVLDWAIATGKYSVELRLKYPQITFINRLVTLGIVPEHAYNENYARHPIGSGPYKFVQWDESQQLIVEANPYYYGKQPNIKRLVILFIQGDGVFAAARASRVQLANVPQSLAVQHLEGMELYALNSKSHTCLMFPYIPDTGRKTPQGDLIGNNVTAERAIRQAINYAIDRKALVEGILEGYGSPAYGPASGLPWEESMAAIEDADPNKAKQILIEAGWRDTDGDGIMDKHGLKAEFWLLYPAEDRIRQGLALAVAQMLKVVGIQAHVEGKSWDNIERRMHSNVVLYGLSTYDQQQLDFLYDSSAARGSYANPGYYANPAVDRALDRARGAASEAEAIAFWKKVQWDGQTGVTTKGDAASAWLVNLDATYFVSNCLDIGRPLQSHSYHGQLLNNLPDWKWVCD